MKHPEPHTTSTHTLGHSSAHEEAMAAAEERLIAVLRGGQHNGFIGPGEPMAHIEHARAHQAAAEPATGERWCDLGSGGGVPGLVFAVDQPGTELVLLDRSQRRVDFLTRAIRDLTLEDRVAIAMGDAAELARSPAHRHAYDGVLSRAFGPPAAVAECSAGLLRTGGRLVVSEPPGRDDARWPAHPLALLGLRLVRITTSTPAFAVLEYVGSPNDRYPRPWKQISKRPLF